jgi:hypothetical protein
MTGPAPRPRAVATLSLLALLAACADPPPVSEFQVQMVAEGTGSIAGAGGALDCTLPSHAGTCHFEVESGTEGLTVTATPAPGFIFTGWRPLSAYGPDGAVAACAGSSEPVCTLPVGVPYVVLRPRFEYPGVLTVAVVGEGVVRSTTHNCGEGFFDQEHCRRSFPAGTVVTLKASGDGFRGWGAPCYEVVTTCLLSVDSLQTIGAYFQQDPPVTSHLLFVRGLGDGAGVVRSLDDGGASIDCTISNSTVTGRCAARLPIAASLRLGLTSEAGSDHNSTPNDCVAGECTVVMDQDRTLLVHFESELEPVTVTGIVSGGHVRFTSTPEGVDCRTGAPGSYTCPEARFLEGTEVTIRAEMWAATSAGPGTDAEWDPCDGGLALCRTVIAGAPEIPRMNVDAPISGILIQREGPAMGSQIVIRVDPMGYTVIRTSQEGSSFLTYQVSQGAHLTLDVTIPPGARFGGWSGACTGLGSCVIPSVVGQQVRYKVIPE